MASIETITFTFYNKETKNNIAGITYLPPPSSHPPSSSSSSKYNNTSPFHFVFAHATGFCKEVYVDVVKELRARGITSPVTSIDHANHGDSTHNLSTDWLFASKDLYAIIENIIIPNDPNKMLIGVGHSMGATVSTAVELAHPNIYKCLILMEPVMPGPPYVRPNTSALTEMTLKRKSVFPNKESVKQAFSAKPPFNVWSPGSLENYIEHGFKDSIIDGKEVVELKAKKEAEAETYLLGYTHGVRDLIPQVTIPFLLLKGSKSNFTDAYYEVVRKTCKTVEYEEVEGGSHFFPMEMPSVVADRVVNFMKKHIKAGLESKL